MKYKVKIREYQLAGVWDWRWYALARNGCTIAMSWRGYPSRKGMQRNYHLVFGLPRDDVVAIDEDGVEIQ